MANQPIYSPKQYRESLRKLEVTDPVHANVVNPLLEQLINNDAFLRDMQERLVQNAFGNFVAAPAGTSALQFTFSDLTATWTGGPAYVNGRLLDVQAGSIELNPNQEQYIYLDTDGTMKKTTSQATAEAGLLLWYFATDASQVITSTDKRKIITPDTYAKKEEVVMKEPGKGLSTNDYSDTEKGKVASHETRLQTIEEEIGEGTPFQTTLLPGLNIVTVPRDTPFNVLNLTGRTLVNLNGRKGREATSNTLTVDSAKRYLIINEGGTSVTVNGTSRPTPYKVTGVTSLNLSWASGEKVAVYDITGDTTIDSLTNAQINAKYPYVDDIKGVRNPYIIRYGKNLLPPFTEWTLHANTKVQSSYELKHTKTTTGTYETSIFRLPAVAGQTYTIAGDIELSGTVGSSGQTATVEIYGFDKNGNYVSHVNNWINENGQSKVSYTVPSNVTHIEGRLTVNANVTGTVTFKNPMLNIGDTPLPFEPQNNDYVFYDVSLHSNIDGTVYDSLFYNGNGQPRKLKRIDEVTVDGSLNVSFGSDYTGFKTVSISLPSTALSTGPGVKIAGIKFDGKVLSMDQTEIQSDSWGLLNVTTASISIADTDSGWSETWAGTTLAKATYTTLTRDATAVDMIKAYFNGWKWDEANKRWFPINNPASYSSDVDYVTNPSNAGAYPYRLLYQLATPVEVPVTSEGEISLHEGDNLLEVGTGVVRREIANPKSDGGSIAIGIDGTKYAPFAGTETRYRIEKVFDVYKNDQADHTWAKNAYDVASYGKVASKNVPANFDSSAAYSITYIVENKYAYTAPLIDLQAEYRTKLAGVVAELAQDQADLATRVSVVETQYARKQQRQWIAPVLLNGYTNVYQSGYYKDEMGIVRLRGRLGIGTTSNSTVIFYLPVGYRPSQNLFVHTPSGDIYIGTDGSIRIYNYASNTGAPNVVLIDGISFRAEQ